MDWRKLITALAAIAAALAGAETMLHEVGLPTEVAAGASLAFLVLTAIGRSVWPDRWQRPPRSGRSGRGLVALLAVGSGLSAQGCTHRAQVRLDTTIAETCEHAALGVALAQSVEAEVCDAKGGDSQACARAEQATDAARQLALQCDPEHPAPRPEPVRPDAGAPPPERPTPAHPRPVSRIPAKRPPYPSPMRDQVHGQPPHRPPHRRV